MKRLQNHGTNRQNLRRQYEYKKNIQDEWKQEKLKIIYNKQNSEIM